MVFVFFVYLEIIYLEVVFFKRYLFGQVFGGYIDNFFSFIFGFVVLFNSFVYFYLRSIFSKGKGWEDVIDFVVKKCQGAIGMDRIEII